MRNESEFVFEPDEHRVFEEALRPADEVLKSTAKRYRMKWLDHGSKGWPGRTLQVRKGLKTYIFRVSLEPAYLDSNSIRWELHDLWMYDWGELYRKTIRFRKLAGGLATDSLQSSSFRDIVERAIAENLGARN